MDNEKLEMMLKIFTEKRYKSEKVTDEKFMEEVEALETKLMDLGLEEKKFAIISEERYEWYLAYLAACRGKEDVVLLDGALPVNELENLINSSGVEAIFYSNKYDKVIQDIKKKTANLKYYISMDSEKTENGVYSEHELVEKGKKLNKKEDVKRKRAFKKFHEETGYSNKELYKYSKWEDNLLDFDGESEFIKKFNLKKSDIDIIIKAITQSAAHHRSSQKSMMATKSNTVVPPDNSLKEKFKDAESLIQTRQNHMREVAEISKIISDGLGLNGDFAYLTGLLHDVGHTWNGHTGERLLSSVARLKNCGYIVHNAMGAYILERENIIDNAIEQVKQFNHNADEKEMRYFMKYVIDGVVSHNGEGTIGKIIPESKTTDKMREEIRSCFTEKGYDKKMLPATMEGAVIRYADIIAYTRSDILDGFRLKDVNGNKIISEFDDDYLSIIGTVIARENNYDRLLTLENKFLLEIQCLTKRIDDLEEQYRKNQKPEIRLEIDRSKKEKSMLAKKYNTFCSYKIEYARDYIKTIENKSEIKTKITSMMQNVFIKDLIEASKGKSYITMSPLIRRTFFALRNLNAQKIVPYTKRNFESEQLPMATCRLVENFSEALIKTGVAYEAIPNSKRKKLGIVKEQEQQEKQKKEKSKKEDNKNSLDFTRKMIHYYNKLEKEKIREIVSNAERAIKNIAKEDTAIALGESEYDGELKELYIYEKINPIRKKIREMGRTNLTMTERDRKELEKTVAAERMKNLEEVVANKMAIEYIGGMTDNTIISVLLNEGLLTRQQIAEGYARPKPGTGEKDKQVDKLQKTFNKGLESMIEPDDIADEEISL